MWEQSLQRSRWVFHTCSQGLAIHKPTTTEVLFCLFTIATQRPNQLTATPPLTPSTGQQWPAASLSLLSAYQGAGGSRTLLLIPNCRILNFSGLVQHVASVPLLPPLTPPFLEFSAPSPLSCQPAQGTPTFIWHSAEQIWPIRAYPGLCFPCKMTQRAIFSLKFWDKVYIYMYHKHKTM